MEIPKLCKNYSPTRVALLALCVALSGPPRVMQRSASGGHPWGRSSDDQGAICGSAREEGSSTYRGARGEEPLESHSIGQSDLSCGLEGPNGESIEIH